MMNINGFGSIPLTSALDGANGATQTQNTRNSSVPPPPTGSSSSISQDGTLFSQLQQLAQQDPTRFKSVLAEMSKELRADAQQQGGQAGTRLTQIADRLDQVAQSGDVSQLAPQPPTAAGGTGAAAYQSTGQHHHHHHHGGGSDIASAIQTAFQTAMSQIGATQSS